VLTERRGAELSVETIIVEPSFETSRWAQSISTPLQGPFVQSRAGAQSSRLKHT